MTPDRPASTAEIETPKSLPMTLRAELEMLHKGLSQAPWSEAYMYAAIRHVVRNCDLDIEDDDEGNTPDRYDGEALAKLRNKLPEIISELAAHDAAELTTMRSALARAEEREAGLRDIGLRLVNEYPVSAFGTGRSDEPGYGSIKAMADALGFNNRHEARAALALRPQSPAPTEPEGKKS